MAFFDHADFPRRPGLYFIGLADVGLATAKQTQGDRFLHSTFNTQIIRDPALLFLPVGLFNALAKPNSPWTASSLETNHLPGHTPHGQSGKDSRCMTGPPPPPTPKSPFPCLDLVGLKAYVFLVFYSPPDQGFFSCLLFSPPNSSPRSKKPIGRRSEVFSHGPDGTDG